MPLLVGAEVRARTCLGDMVCGQQPGDDKVAQGQQPLFGA